MTEKKKTDIRIRAIRTSYASYRYRAPIKFGGRTVTSCDLLNVECEVVTRDGSDAQGFGSMPLGNTWAYPSATMDNEQTLAAMKLLAGRCAKLCEEHAEFGHPVDLGTHLEEGLSLIHI